MSLNKNWIEIFLKRVKDKGVRKIEICKLINRNEKGFYYAIQNDTFKFSEILTIYNHYGWSLDELQETNIVEEPINIYSINSKNSDKEHIRSLKEEISFLRKQIETIQKEEGKKLANGA